MTDISPGSSQALPLAAAAAGAPPAPPSDTKAAKKRTNGWIGTSHPYIYWRPRTSRDHLSPSGLPLPPIRSRARRPHAIHIIAYPPGFVPYDLRPGYNAARAAAAAVAAASKKRRPAPARSAAARFEYRKSKFTRVGRKTQTRSSSSPVRDSLGRVGFGNIFAPFHTLHHQKTRNIDRPPSPALAAPLPEGPMSRPLSMVEAMLAAQNPSAYRPLSRLAPKNAISSQVVEISKPVATGSGVACSILLAESHVFLAGFDHDGRNRHDVQGGTALLRGRLQLNVTKNVKIKAVTLKLVGKARTEWPEGIPPAKQETFEEESLRTQVLTFFNAMHDGWETSHGNQCTYSPKPRSNNSSRTNLALQISRNSSYAITSGPALAAIDRSLLLAREGRRLSVQSAQSRSFGKDDSLVSSTQAKGYRVFCPGTYDYSFELPLDHHQLETTKLQFGSVRWELHATIERAGAFKPNLHGVKEVSIVRVPDQMSLETSEPISISRRWEDQLHYDIIISGKSFPIGGRIPIAFKLTPLAKVQIHKLKVYVSESIEYWTNDRRVTRRDPGRKILLLEKSAGKPLDAAYAASELRVLSGGELDAGERVEARQQAVRRREAEASIRSSTPRPLPEQTDNLLGDLDLGLESFWGPTEIEASVQMPTCEMMAKNKDLRLHPDCSWKNVNVFHWIRIVLRLSRADPEDPSGTRRHFEISIDSPFTVLNCRATQANTSLPEYSNSMDPNHPSSSTSIRTMCGCPDAAIIASEHSPAASTLSLALPAPPQAAHLAPTSGSTAALNSNEPAPDYTEAAAQPQSQAHRPIHFLRAPSFNPPAFDADQPPPPIEFLGGTTVSAPPTLTLETATPLLEPLMTPPPHYDLVVGTPSVDGLADYFSRLADYGYDAAVEDEEDSDSLEDDHSVRARPRLVDRHSGRVNVINPRTPGPRHAPSRSMDVPRPLMQLSLSSRRTPGRGPSS